MCRLRLLRISLILALLGPPAHAESAAPAAAAKAPAPSPALLRPEMHKLLDPAAIRDLMTARDYARVRGRIEQAAALPAPSEYERFTLNRLRIALAAAGGDGAMAIPELEAALESGAGPSAERAPFIEALASHYYNAKNYPQAIRWFLRYQNETGNPAALRPYLIRAYYFNHDFASARQALLDDLQADEQAGRQPGVDQLQLLANCGAQAGDAETYRQALEKLVRFHPSDEYWSALLNRVAGAGAPVNIELEALRLERAAVRAMTPEKYLRLAQLALRAGFPAEAKQALEAGYAAGALGAGADAAAHRRLRELAARAASADRGGVAKALAAAQRSPNGAGLVKLGYEQVTMLRVDKGIELIEKGVARGVAKNPDLARLRLGYAYALAGRREQARDTLGALGASGGAGAAARLARYWLLWLERPAGG